MSDSNRPDGPAGDGTLSFDEGADAITDILSPEDFPDPDETDESINADEADEVEGDEPEAEDVEDEDVVDPDEMSDDEDEDGPDEEAVSIDDQLVTMADGQQITVRELRDHADNRIKEMQRTFTQRTTEVAEERKRVEAEAQTLSQQRDFLANWLQAEMPQQPDPSIMESDPIGYLQQKDAYDRKVQKWQQLQQHLVHQQQQSEAENRKKAESIIKQEREALMQAMPHLKDQKRFNEFRENAIEIGTSVYGFEPEMITGATDHRFLKALNDLIAYQKLKAKAPKAKEAMKGKPKVLRGSNRGNGQKTSQNQRARADRLAKTGDFDAGVAALMDIID